MHVHQTPPSLAALLCFLILTIPAGAAQPASAPGAVPSIVLLASAANTADLRGALGMQRHFSTTIKAGPIRHTETSESGVLFNNGAFVKIKYYRVVEDGKTFSAKQLADREAQTNRDWAAGKIFFKEPYDQRYLGDYAFAQPQVCAGCPKYLMAVTFTSSLQDAQHGNGTMWVDTRTNRVTELIYTPNVLPSHATSGSVTEISSNPAPGIWYVTRIDEAYRGHELIVSGTGTFTGTFDRLRRFASLAQGQAALESGTI
jgi:hypothetical protein